MNFISGFKVIYKWLQGYCDGCGKVVDKTFDKRLQEIQEQITIVILATKWTIEEWWEERKK